MNVLFFSFFFKRLISVVRKAEGGSAAWAVPGEPMGGATSDPCLLLCNGQGPGLVSLRLGQGQNLGLLLLSLLIRFYFARIPG